MLATHAGQSMRKVVSGAGDVARLIDEISQASQAQSLDIVEFSHGMDELEKGMEIDTENVRQVASASDNLSARAQALKDSMSVFLIARY
jgi:methyl-accepting chemotaxis protein